MFDRAAGNPKSEGERAGKLHGVYKPARQSRYKARYLRRDR